MRGKIFTRDEADRMVPLLRRIVVGIRARHRLIGRRQGAQSGSEPGPSSSSAGAAARARDGRILRRLQEELKDFTAELESLGCFLRDAASGVIECYGELNGDIVYFAWQPGREGFDAWHPLDQSFVNRQPMPALESGASF